MLRIHSSPARNRTMPAEHWARVGFSALLAALVIFLLPSQASAQELNVPQSRNPYLRKIAHLYEALEYESALQLIPKAEKHPSNKDQEALWLELMQGILYYSLHDSQQSDAAFLLALKKAPFTSLPLLNPSQTLYEHFNALRQEVTPTGRTKSETSKLHPASTAAPPSSSPNTASGISETALQEKLNALEQRGREMAGGSIPPTIASSLKTLRQQARQAQTAHERMIVATTVDLWMNLLNEQQAVAPSVPASASAPAPGMGPVPSPEEDPLEPESERLLHPISREFLGQRMAEMKTWLNKNVQNPRGRLEVLELLDHARDQLEASQNAHERMSVAIKLDNVEEQMARRFGWKIKNPRPEVAAPSDQ